MMQLDFDFTNAVHTRENNSFSEAILEANSERIGKQCKKVWELLNAGVRLTVKSAMIEHNISSLPRRVLDLKTKLKADIKTNILPGGYAEYYLNKTAETLCQ